MTESAAQEAQSLILQDYPHWVVWKYESREGLKTKVPYRPIRTDIKKPQKAKPNDPETWGTYQEARAAVAFGGFEGLGYMFAEDDPFCGIDLDAEKDAKGNITKSLLAPTGNIIEPWAADIVDVLASYTEYSPSKSGLHIIVAAQLPEGGNRRGQVEMYDRRRFFTITGQTISKAHSQVHARQRQLTTLHQAIFPKPTKAPPQEHAPNPSAADLEVHDIIGLLERDKNADKIMDVWNGDLSHHNGNHSEADLFLCSKLAFYAGGDPEKIDAAFRKSALMRDKWNERRGSKLYSTMTIERALEGMSEFYTPPGRSQRRSANRKPHLTGEHPSFDRNRAPADAKDAKDARSLQSARPLHLPAPDPFPVAAMPEGCQLLIKETAASMRCPPEFIAMPMLGALSSAIGTTRVMQINRGWTEHAALFLAVVAPPGSMKTPAASIAIKPLEHLRRRYERQYFEEKETYERKLREYEVAKQEARKSYSPAPPPPEPPHMKRTDASDTTVEALAPILQDNPRGIFLHRDELAGWIRSMDQYRASGKGGDTEHWLSLWSNQTWVIDRKAKLGEPVIITRPFVSLFGGLTPHRLGELGNPMEDGMMERFLFAYPVTRKYRFTEAEPSPKAEALYDDLYTKVSELKSGLADGQVSPKPLRMDFAAKQAFRSLVDQLADESEIPGFPLKLESVWAKLRGYLGRLSLIFACCRIAATPRVVGVASDPTEEITAEDVLRAGQLLEYFKSHARRVFDAVLVADPTDTFAGDIRMFLEAREGDDRYEGTATDLLELLQERGIEHLPATPKGLSQKLRDVASQVQGLKFESKHTADKSQRHIVISLESPHEDASDASDASAGEAQDDNLRTERTERTHPGEDSSVESSAATHSSDDEQAPPPEPDWEDD